MLRKLSYIVTVTCLTFIACSEDGQQEKVNDLLQAPVDGKDTSNFGFSTDLTDDIAAYKTVVNIIRETGLAQNFVILPGDVNTVKAYIEDNERILEYNPRFMERLEGKKKDWEGISVLARQIGHHLSQHDLNNDEPTIKEEIEADKYAGFVLYKMGANLDEALAALNDAMDEDSLNMGISKNARLASLTKGWNNAKTLMSDTIVATNNQGPNLDSAEGNVIKQPAPVNRPDYLYKVFLALDTTVYFVDEEGKVFEETGSGRHKPVGLRKESDKPGFDWIFVKEGDSYGVDSKGRLWAFSTDGNFHIVGQAVKLNMK